MAGPIKVGLIGARRIHQGLGPFIARDLHANGAEISLVLGRTQESADEAARVIGDGTGLRPKTTSTQSSFLAADLDAVCVLTPKGTHGEYLNACLAADKHVLCEKPVFWHPEPPHWGALAVDLEDRFAAKGLVLAVNAQWPWALSAFEELHGPILDVSSSQPTSLAMGLAPASTGREMIGDAAPHPLSLAQALRPDLDRIASVAFGRFERNAIDFTAVLRGERGDLELRVELRGSGAPPPREAWFAIDGKRVDRCVRTSDYKLFLRDGARIADLPDPLSARIAAFIKDVAAAESMGRRARTPDRTISRRAAMLAVLDRAFTAAEARKQ